MNNSYYVGSTNDILKRLHQHNSREVKSTRAYAPWEVYYLEQFEDRNRACARETQIKSWKKRAMIEKLKSNEVEDPRFLLAKIGKPTPVEEPLAVEESPEVAS